MSTAPFSPTDLQQILSHWDIDSHIETSPHQGLINHTFLIGKPTQGVLQWVNPIFDAKIHLDIDAFTSHLQSKGLTTTHLLPTKDGTLYIPAEHGGYWRILKFIKGKTYDRLDSTTLAFEAGKLVGTVHKVLQDFEHSWQAPFRDAHNTELRMANLESALNEYDDHPLYDAVSALGSAILQDWQQWKGILDLPTRPTHGDLKISNLHFNADGTGCCLLDLDTIGPGDVSIEMGDAWRSWCNPAGESNPEDARFDIDLFEASASGWLSTVGDLTTEEQQSLPFGIHRICLELSARFAADALQNSYFKEDRATFPDIGSHNLHRARTQLALAKSVQSQLSAMEEFIRTF